MALFDDASLVVTPNGYKEGTLYSIKPTSGLGDMTVVRATTATRVNSAGLIELVPYNLLQYSEQFNNAAWSTQDATITANSTTAPNGTLTADTFTRTANTAFLYATNAFSLITGSYSISVYAKANATSSFRLDLGSSGLSQGVTCTFNLSTATAGTPILYGSASSFVATIENVGNGWYRCSLSGNLISANYYAELAITTTGSIYIWGAQLNDGSLKDYLRTETRLNIPRLDYSNGTCPSLLVEPQRTNISLYSQQFDNINWSKENSSITSNQLISPDGNLTADIITDNSTNDRHIIFEAFTGDFSTSRTFSTYAKQGSLRYLVLSITSINDSASCYSAIFDLQTGTITATKNNGTATVTASIQNAGNGWYRCIISGTLGIGVLAYFPIIGTSNRATFTGSLVNNNIPVYVGSGQSLYIWGAQLEVGSYPTSYIPTTSAAVTRNADVISKTGISSLIGQTEGTIFVEEIYDSSVLNNGGLDDTLVSLSDGTTNNLISIFHFGGGIETVLFFIRLSNVTQVAFYSSVLPSGTYKIAMAYKNNDVAFYINGVQLGTDTSASIPATSALTLVDPVTVLAATKTVNFKSIALFKTRLTNAELASLTTI